MVEEFLLLGNVLLGCKNFFVLSKVWDKIISWNFLWLIWNSQLVTMLSFSLFDIKGCKLNVTVHTEVRDEVVSWWWFWWIKSGTKLLSKLLLS